MSTDLQELLRRAEGAVGKLASESRGLNRAIRRVEKRLRRMPGIPAAVVLERYFDSARGTREDRRPLALRWLSWGLFDWKRLYVHESVYYGIEPGQRESPTAHETAIDQVDSHPVELVRTSRNLRISALDHLGELVGAIERGARAKLEQLRSARERLAPKGPRGDDGSGSGNGTERS